MSSVLAVTSTLCIDLTIETAPQLRRRLRRKQATPLVATVPRRRLRGKQSFLHPHQLRPELDSCLVDYKFFGLPAGATPAEIKKAYYARALVDHPDKKGASNEAFKTTDQTYRRLLQRVSVGGRSQGTPRAGIADYSLEVFRWSFLELSIPEWAHRLKMASAAQLLHMRDWFSRPDLSPDDTKVWCTRSRSRSRCVRDSNIYSTKVRGQTFFWIEKSLHTLRCYTKPTIDLNEVIRWQADLLEMFARFNASLKACVPIDKIALSLSSHLVLQYHFRVSVAGKVLCTPSTFDLLTALEHRKKLVEAKRARSTQAGLTQAGRICAKLIRELDSARECARRASSSDLLWRAAAGELQQRSATKLLTSLPLPTALALTCLRPRPRNEREDAAASQAMPSIGPQNLEHALAQITWPKSNTRKQAMPEHVSHVKAFALGLVAHPLYLCIRNGGAMGFPLHEFRFHVKPPPPTLQYENFPPTRISITL